MKGLGFAAWLVLPFLGGSWVASQEKTQAPEMQVIDYEGLKELILKQRGQVVLVDFWQILCPPCERNMKHLREMQKKGYEQQGLVLLTVNLDEPNTEEFKDVQQAVQDVRQRALVKLQRTQATTFTNYWLNESRERVEKLLRFSSVPSVFVFSRQGQWTHFKSDNQEIDAHEVEKLVVQLLQEKGKGPQ